MERSESLFVWLEMKGQKDETPVSLSVSAAGHAEAAWVTAAPRFLLTAQPDLAALGDGYVYAVSIDGGTPILLASGEYTAAEEGQYALQFHLLAPDGSAVAVSAVYTVWLDAAAPLVQIKAGASGTLQITAGDALSGGDAVSMDGGATWLPLTPGEGSVSTYTYTTKQTVTFPRESIIVRDQAGNQTVYPEEVTVRIMSGSRGGSSSRSTSHSESTTDTVVAYDGVELTLTTGKMSQLKVGGEMMELSLQYNGTDASRRASTPTFTASFINLTRSSEKNTLMLVASDATAADAGDYTWFFSGQVCKKLSVSGIEYIMLRIEDEVTLLPTSGFSAGLRYNMCRAEGLVSKDFSYAVRMGLEDYAMELDVTVAESTYRMSNDPNAEFYYYDVFTGPIEALEWLLTTYGKIG